MMAYLKRYLPDQQQRHLARPGIIGWAQVHGRNNLPWEQRFALDLWYLENLSLWLDLKILALTFWKELKCEGNKPPGQRVIDSFKGAR